MRAAHNHDRFARETAAIARRTVAWRQSVLACPHNGGWLQLGEHMQCQSCGLVAAAHAWEQAIKWHDYPPQDEPDDALGTALAAWDTPPKWGA